MIAQSLTDADDTAHTGFAIVYAMLLGILYETGNERGHTHDAVGLDASNGVPLKLGNTVAHPDDGSAKPTDTEEIGQAGHKTLVDGGHQLQDVTGPETGTSKALGLVKGQPLQVFLRAAESDGVAKRATGRDVVNNLLPRHTKEVVVEELQVFLLRERNGRQVFKMPYLADVDALTFKHPLIVGGVVLQIQQRLMEFLLLKGLNGLKRFKFNILFHLLHDGFNPFQKLFFPFDGFLTRLAGIDTETMSTGAVLSVEMRHTVNSERTIHEFGIMMIHNRVVRAVDHKYRATDTIRMSLHR